MLYDVYVQGKPYKSIEAEFTHQVLTQVTLDLENDRVPGRDHSRPPRVVVRPSHMPKLTEAAADELFKPKPVTPPAPVQPEPPAPPVTPTPAANVDAPGGAPVTPTRPRAEMKATKQAKKK